ncbi:hypothetical protein FQR65_LT09231 [Abscondita terminalis]|nr:hypothetical protein FQR65_LT09231 [Abscondita terminalis]
MTIISCCGISCLYKSKLMEVISDVIKIDNCIENFSKERLNHEKSKLRLMFFMILFASIETANLLGGNVSAYLDDIYDLDVWSTNIYAFTTVCNININLTMLFIIGELKLRIRVVHKIGKTIFVNQQTVKTHLRFVKQMYDFILKVAKEVNNIFNFLLLVQISMSTVFSVFGSYWATSGTFNGKPITYFRIAGAGIWVWSTTVNMAYTVYIYSHFEYEAKKTVQLMEDLEKAVGKSNLPYKQVVKTVNLIEDLERAIGKSNLPYKQVELFSLQVYVEDFKFSLYGCFPLDWTLLHSMVAGVATYLVIFHQFSNMEKNVQSG